MLTVEAITCAYGPIVAVRALSLEAADGALVCILGANGAGKSTTLKTIAGSMRPRQGRITFDGMDITRLDAAQRVARGIALCPEGRRVFTDFTVEQNLLAGGHLLSRQETRRRCADACDLFPVLAERMMQGAASLSGGEQQMLAIGRALMTRPKLLLLDEPSLGLAPVVIQQVFAVIQEIRARGASVIVVEQNARMALKIADYAYVLSNGRVDVAGSAAEIAASGEIERSYLGGLS